MVERRHTGAAGVLIVPPVPGAIHAQAAAKSKGGPVENPPLQGKPRTRRPLARGDGHEGAQALKVVTAETARAKL